jgi:hypothetical protein
MTPGRWEVWVVDMACSFLEFRSLAYGFDV